MHASFAFNVVGENKTPKCPRRLCGTLWIFGYLGPSNLIEPILLKVTLLNVKRFRALGFCRVSKIAECHNLLSAACQNFRMPSILQRSVPKTAERSNYLNAMCQKLQNATIPLTQCVKAAKSDNFINAMRQRLLNATISTTLCQQLNVIISLTSASKLQNAVLSSTLCVEDCGKNKFLQRSVSKTVECHNFLKAMRQNCRLP